MEEIILFEPFIDVSNESDAIKEYTATLRKEIIWSHFSDWDNERELAIKYDAGFLGELDDLWYKSMDDAERKRADAIAAVWCHANLGWYEQYDVATLDFYEGYKVENAKLLASDNPPQRISPQTYFEIRRELTGQ